MSIFVKSVFRTEALRLSGLRMLLIALSFLVVVPSAVSEPPAVKFEEGAFVSISSADAYFASHAGASVHTNRLCELGRLCLVESKIHIKEMARSLGANRLQDDVYVQNVYEYIFANVELEFRYGLGKGGFGALIDGSGSPFDQAQLMVEFLREGGIDASYQVGAVSLSAAEFANWLGFFDSLPADGSGAFISARAACQLLANGGIPGVINNSSHRSDCGYSGQLSSITFSHVWVVADGVKIDPSFKIHELTRSSSALSAGLDCPAGSISSCATIMVSAALPPASIKVDSVGKYAQNVDASALNSSLTAFAIDVQAQIESELPLDARLHDVVGGKKIDLAAIREWQLGLPYSASVRHTWHDEVPDAYRTRYGVNFAGFELADGSFGSALLADKALFVDEIYGFPIFLVGEKAGETFPTTRSIRLKAKTWHTQEYAARKRWQPSNVLSLFNQVELGESLNQTISSDSLAIEISIDHPYPGSSGKFMDETLLKNLRVGECFEGISCRNSNVVHQVLLPLNIGNLGSPHVSSISRNIGEAPDVKSVVDSSLSDIASWQFQMRHLLRLIDSIHGAQSQHHHSLGAVVQWRVRVITSGGSISAPKSWRTDTAGMLFDVESTLSMSLLNESDENRRSGQFVAATMISGLEGDVIAQSRRNWAGHTVQSFFDLSNRKGAKFYDVNAQNVSSFFNIAQDYHDFEEDHVRSYTELGTTGYSLILPQKGNLGSYSAVVEHGASFIGDFHFYTDALLSLTNAERELWSLDFLIAPVLARSSDGARVAYTTTFGGKGAADPGSIIEPAEMLENIAQFSSANDGYSPDVSLKDGEISISFAPDITVGSEDFPRGLSFVRTYSSVQARHDSAVEKLRRACPFECNSLSGSGSPFDISGQGPLAPLDLSSLYPRRGLPAGWSHNFEVGASISSDGVRGYGHGQAKEAAANIAGIMVLLELARDLSFENTLASIFVSRWLLTQNHNNTVSIKNGHNEVQFFRLANGEYNPPPAMLGSLSVSQSPATMLLPEHGFTYYYREIEISYTDVERNAIHFSSLSKKALSAQSSQCSVDGAGPSLFNEGISDSNYVADNWNFQTGVTVSFEYSIERAGANASDGCAMMLSQVSNNVGRSLYFSPYAETKSKTSSIGLPMSSYPALRVEDSHGRAVNITTSAHRYGVSDGGVEFELPGGQKSWWKSAFSLSGDPDLLGEFTDDSVAEIVNHGGIGLYLDDQRSGHAFMYQVDGLGRVKSVEDAEGRRTTYFPSGLGGEFYSRGELLGATGDSHISFFGKDGQVLMSISPSYSD